MKKILMMVALLFVCGSVMATDYFVKPTGLSYHVDNNNGESYAEALSLGEVFGQTSKTYSAGDRIFIAPGIYAISARFSWFASKGAGEAGNPIQVIGDITGHWCATLGGTTLAAVLSDATDSFTNASKVNEPNKVIIDAGNIVYADENLRGILYIRDAVSYWDITGLVFRNARNESNQKTYY